MPSARSTSTRDLDVAGGDHLHVDALAPARAANIRSATPVCVRMPVPTTDTLLTCSSNSMRGAQLGGQRPQHVERRPAARCPGTVKPMAALPPLPTFWAIMSTTMLLIGDGREDAMADARLVRHAVERDAGLVLDQGGAAHDDVAHPVRFRHDPGSLDVAERRAHLQRHVELLGELDASASA